MGAPPAPGVLKIRLMSLKKTLKRYVLHQWLESIKCLKTCNISFPGLLSFYYAFFDRGRTVIFTGPGKRSVPDFGIVTLCIAPVRVNDQYVTNVLLKIKAKVAWRS